MSNADGTEPACSRVRSLSIFLLIRSLELGGAQRQLVELATGLRERGHRVIVAIFYSEGPLVADLQRAGVQVAELRKDGRWDVVPFLWRLRRVIREARPDVLYSFVGSANIFAAILRPFLRGTKLVWSIRASDMELEHYDWAHRLAYRIECRLSSVADLIISNSQAGLAFAAANGFPRKRIAIVPNGIDAVRFRPDPSLRQIQREKWGIADTEIAVGMLARLDPMKGHADFLQAAARIGRRPDVRLLCIGGGKEERRLKRMAADLAIADRILFPGPTHDPVSALNGLDIFCSASVWGEGFSNAIAEAMACGLRCVVTDVGDSAFIVGGCGAIVPRSNPAALADAILDQLRTRPDGEFLQPRARIVEQFSIDAMVDRTLVLFGDLADCVSALP